MGNAHSEEFLKKSWTFYSKKGPLLKLQIVFFCATRIRVFLMNFPCLIISVKFKVWITQYFVVLISQNFV